MLAPERKLTMSSYDDTPDVKPATGAQALPTESGYSPLPDRRGKATAEATTDDDGSERMPPPADIRRVESEDEPEADSK
jgi:hypothetical protein